MQSDAKSHLKIIVVLTDFDAQKAVVMTRILNINLELLQKYKGHKLMVLEG